jgi:uncharacterized protein YdhG (YjbR/CyaY superfamily)
METNSVDTYFEQAPADCLDRLNRMRDIAMEEIPDGELVMAYGIPTVKLGKAVVHFAAYERHIGFYPGAEVMKKFEPRLKMYKRAKGSVQFPLDRALPEALIRDMIRARLLKMAEKASA